MRKSRSFYQKKPFFLPEKAVLSTRKSRSFYERKPSAMRKDYLFYVKG